MKKQILHFCQKMLRVRRRLMDMQRSKYGNALQMIGHMKHIQQWIDFNSNTSNDWQAARWFIENKGFLSMIMPGHGSASHEAFKQELDTLISDAQNLLNHGQASSVLHQRAA